MATTYVLMPHSEGEAMFGFKSKQAAWGAIGLCAECQQMLTEGQWVLNDFGETLPIHHICDTPCAAEYDVVTQREYEELLLNPKTWEQLDRERSRYYARRKRTTRRR